MWQLLRTSLQNIDLQKMFQEKFSFEMEKKEFFAWLVTLLLSHVFFARLIKRLAMNDRKLPPGPKGLPIVGCLPLLGTMPHVSLAKLAKKYGPVMYLKLGTSGIMVATSPAAAKAVTKTLDVNFSSRPANANANILGYDCHSMVWSPYGPRWTRLRKLCNLHILGPKAMEEKSFVKEAEVGTLLKRIFGLAVKGLPVKLADLLNVCTANMLGMLVLNKRVFETDGDEANEFKEMVVELMQVSGQFNLADFIPQIGWMDLQRLHSAMRKLHTRWDDLISRMIADHGRGKVAGDKDFLGVLLKECKSPANEGAAAISYKDVKALVLDLFAAGTDTSSSVVEWIICELIDNPKLLSKVHAELDRVVGRDRRITEADIPSLPYLQAVCKEGLRKHPPTPLGIPRIAEQSSEVGGYCVPKGTRVLVNIWGIHRDPAVWDRPEVFEPDRFIGSKIEPRGNDYELIPFGAGRRICAGTRMGLANVEYMLASLLHAFDWDVTSPTDRPLNMDEAFGLTLQRAVPLVAKATPRLPLRLYQ